MPVVYRRLQAWEEFGTVLVLYGEFHIFVVALPDMVDDDWDRAIERLEPMVLTTTINYQLGDAWCEPESGVDVYRFHYPIPPARTDLCPPCTSP